MIKNNIIFDKPLKEGLILRRGNRFLMDVLIAGKVQICHCPCTGSINNLIFENIPCLFSENSSLKRKTKYTVEAISLNKPAEKKKYWIGINQNKANRYIEFFLEQNILKNMVDCKTLAREQKINNSKIDFLVNNNCYLEVKTPLTHLNLKPCYYTNYNIKQKGIFGYESIDRFFKHMDDLANSLKNNQRAILLAFFMFELDKFDPPLLDKNSDVIAKKVEEIRKRGVEMWQVSATFNEHGLNLYNCKPLKL